MSKIKYGILLSILALFTLLFPTSAQALEEVTLHLFYGDGCPHCAKEKEFLKTIEDQYPNLTIKMYEVWKDTNNADLLTKVKEELEADSPYVPYTVIGEIGITGYNENIQSQIIHFIEKYSNTKHQDIVTLIQEGKPIVKEDNKEESREESEEQGETFELPVFGKISPKEVSLPLLAVVIGAVDGFNPCAMWVLLFLISMLIGMKDKRKMWILGLTFLFASAFVYFLFMVSWLKVALSITSIIWIRNIIALVAIGAGSWNLFQFYKHQDSGCTIVKEEKRKKVFTKIRKITEEKKFYLALLGIVALAVSVNLVELACSAGLPLLFTQILAYNDLETWKYFALIILYIIFFLLDDIIVFIVAMKTLEVSGISTKYTKFSHLIGGAILVIIGILLLVKPGLLMFNLS